MIGIYNITSEIDYDNSIKEINEINNKNSNIIEVFDTNPIADIIVPTTGTQYTLDSPITFIGDGSDSKDEQLNETYYNWTSSKDGYLGNGSIIYTNLSLGDHIIYLTVRDSDGYNNTDRIIVSVVPSTAPVVTINSPKNNQVFKEGEIIYFNGKAIDHEDGNLSGNSLIWNSSINGTFAIGESANTSKLGVGTHIINLQATDSSNVIINKSIIITIQESTPLITINQPPNGTTKYYTQNIIFNATSNDPHEGDLSNKINWTSNINGYIGIGSQYLRTLSPGFHTITSFIKDNTGLTNIARI